MVHVVCFPVAQAVVIYPTIKEAVMSKYKDSENINFNIDHATKLYHDTEHEDMRLHKLLLP